MVIGVMSQTVEMIWMTEEQKEKKRKRANAYYWANREKCLAKMKVYASSHPRIREKKKDYLRKYWLKSKYGLTPEQFEIMKVQQGGVCKICKNRPAAAVDHCHKTGKVRGLLCKRCNSTLHEIEQEGWLDAAQEYLCVSRL
jgi:hypothetical protein